MDEALKQNGDTLDAHTRAGIENQKNILTTIDQAEQGLP